MLGPYSAKKDKEIYYKGNKIFEPISDVSKKNYPKKEMENRVISLKDDPMWEHIAKINHRINISANNYFDDLGAIFTALPLTTRMISSPGAVYGKEAISYTSDTSPITLQWFDLKGSAFLSESSQIYLEIALMQNNIDQVYSIYNSFRKEHADATHLSEFHHIEYEGKVDQNKNEQIALGLVGKVIKDLLKNNTKDLEYFLENKKLNNLDDLADDIKKIPLIPFKEALDILYDETKDELYKKFTMDGTFGSWEEIKLTEILENMVGVKEFPLLEVPFYHAQIEKDGILVAENTDLIWPGYRETIGSGHRVRSSEELEKKAIIFDLPRNDYIPYLQTRNQDNYEQTSGFGLGWERLLQGILEMPFIWSASQFPRGHNTLKP